MTREVASDTFDELDMNLISELEIDAGQSYLDLAAKLETSPTTVSRRLQKLLDRGAITISAMPDLAAFGFTTKAMLGISVRPGSANEVANELALCDDIQHIIATTGSYDIIAWSVFHNYRSLLDFVSQRVGHITDITNTEIVLCLETIKVSWSYLQDRNYADSYEIRQGDTKRKPDSLDVALVHELQLNSKQTITQLASKLGMSRSVIHKRLQSLETDHLMTFVCEIEPSTLGYTLRVAILIKTSPSQLRSVADQLAAYRNIQHIAIMTGRFDLFAFAIFPDASEMYEFIGSELGAIAGVVRHETLLVVRVVKSSFNLPATEILINDDNQA